LVESNGPVMCYGEGLVSRGLEVRDGISGLGLVSDGFLWWLYDIWLDIQAAAVISTSWSNTDGSITTSWSDTDSVISTSWSNTDGAVTTTWSDSNSAITTTWTSMQYGSSGEYLP